MKDKITTILLAIFLIIINLNCFTIIKAEELPMQQLKVLGIGNSFTVDATTYLRDIATCGGVDLTVGTLQIGGSTLEMHWNNTQTNEDTYTYTKNDSSLAKYYPKKDIKSVVLSEDWDFIVLQQVSYLSGDYESYQPYLNNLVDFIRDLKPTAEILLQQTWAYDVGSSHYEFYRYDNNQATMYNALKDAYSQASNEIKARIIPSGNAVQNARSYKVFDCTNGGKSLTRDSYHMSNTHGRILVASTWYEILTGKSIFENTYTNIAVTNEELLIIKQAVHNAVVEYTDYKIININIKKLPNKINYSIGEDVISEGGIITINYNNGQSCDEEITDKMITYNLNSSGETTVEINYSGATTNYTVKVNSAKGCSGNSTNSIMIFIIVLAFLKLITKN